VNETNPGRGPEADDNPSPASNLPTDHWPLTTDHVLYEDPHLLILNKPAPLLTQAPPGIPNLEALAKAYIKAKYAKPAGVYLGVPHRLDRPVSGVVCFARNTKAAQRVHAQFQDHKVRKVYWALVEGDVTPDAGVWDDWVRKVPEEARVERTKEGEPGAKLAMLEYRVLRRFAPGAVSPHPPQRSACCDLPLKGGGDELTSPLEGEVADSQRESAGGGAFGMPETTPVTEDHPATTLVELAPLTGRMHQLRVQAAWRGHAVLGDAAYGSARAFGPPAELPRDRVIALHARSLTLTHPFTKEALTVVAPLPEYWGDIGV
jgi:23S rRNA pseudouridine1911/1915/1917 synthase